MFTNTEIQVRIHSLKFNNNIKNGLMLKLCNASVLHLLFNRIYVISPTCHFKQCSETNSSETVVIMVKCNDTLFANTYL